MKTFLFALAFVTVIAVIAIAQYGSNMPLLGTALDSIPVIPVTFIDIIEALK